ncbi:MAG TPA: hypothetical protein VGS60_06680 [Actinomycetes bacterium]|nr:hypothetical protein [Actinomycetes bacterium]
MGEGSEWGEAATAVLGLRGLGPRRAARTTLCGSEGQQVVGVDDLRAKLVMVVGPWEFRAGHIPGSLGFPSPRSALAALGRDDKIILYANDLIRRRSTAAPGSIRGACRG